MKILITGTAGFIGFHLTNKLLELGHEVVGLDSINDYYDVNVKYGRLAYAGIKKEDIAKNAPTISSKNENYTFIQGELENNALLEQIFQTQKLDAVCNLAAQAGVRYSLTNPRAYINSNIVGFVNLLECCRNFDVKNLCFASSSSVYGLNTSLPFSTDDNVDHPISLYAASKKSNELMAHTYSHLFGIQATGLRFFTVYGPWGRPDMALFLFVKAALEKRKIDVFNHGDMLRDFTYIDDIVKGVIEVLLHPARADSSWQKTHRPSTSSAPYKIYNIGNNNPVKLMDFIEAIERKLNKKIEKNFLPLQAGDVKATYANVDDLVENLGYKPKTPIQEGIDKFIDWYIEFFGVKI